MVNGDIIFEGREDRLLYKKCELDVSEIGFLQRIYSSGSGIGRKFSGSLVGFISSGIKIFSVIMLIRFVLFVTRRVFSSLEKLGNYNIVFEIIVDYLFDLI